MFARLTQFRLNKDIDINLAEAARLLTMSQKPPRVLLTPTFSFSPTFTVRTIVLTAAVVARLPTFSQHLLLSLRVAVTLLSPRRALCVLIYTGRVWGRARGRDLTRGRRGTQTACLPTEISHLLRACVAVSLARPILTVVIYAQCVDTRLRRGGRWRVVETKSFPAGLGAVLGHPVLVGPTLSSVGPGLAPRVVVDVLTRAVFTPVTRLPAVERHVLWVLGALPPARPLLALFMLVQTFIGVHVVVCLRRDLCPA